jgi:hypothetical protein
LIWHRGRRPTVEVNAQPGDSKPNRRALVSDQASINEPQQRVGFLAAAEDHDRLAGQVGGGEFRFDVGHSTVVDVGAALLDCAAGVAFAFGQTAFDQCVNERQSAGEPVARELTAGYIREDFAQLAVA